MIYQHEVIKLQEEGKIIGEEKRVYLPSLYFAEKGLVTSINRILEQTEYKEQFPESEFLLALGELRRTNRRSICTNAKRSHSNSVNVTNVDLNRWTRDRENNCY